MNDVRKFDYEQASWEQVQSTFVTEAMQRVAARKAQEASQAAKLAWDRMVGRETKPAAREK
jgi:hypothetical protein